MKIANVIIRHSPDIVLGDLFFGIDGGISRPGTRLDLYCDAFIDCLQRLDRDGVYTFTDPESNAYVRFLRNGEEVLVQSHGTTGLDDGPTMLKYATFRAGILAMLDMYREQIAEAVPTHPEDHRLQARMEAIENG
jgi:hypothetical protein